MLQGFQPVSLCISLVTLPRPTPWSHLKRGATRYLVAPLVAAFLPLVAPCDQGLRGCDQGCLKNPQHSVAWKKKLDPVEKDLGSRI